LTLQYDKVIYMIKPGPDTDKIAGQHVTVFDYLDGRFKIRHEGRELPYSVVDRLSQIRQADIVNNKRLRTMLSMAREAQLENNERRSKSCLISIVKCRHKPARAPTSLNTRQQTARRPRPED
jgi:hypothetical protein